MAQLAHRQSETPIQRMALDPVCGMPVDPASAATSRTLDSVTHYFCSNGCARQSPPRLSASIKAKSFVML